MMYKYSHVVDDALTRRCGIWSSPREPLLVPPHATVL